MTLTVELTPELEELVTKKVAGGMYPSASEVVREGLRLLKEQDVLQELRLDELRNEVGRGFEQLERGEFTEYSSAEEITHKVIAEGRKRAAAEKANV